MKWFFQPDGDRTGARQDGEEDSGPGQISLSPELLVRHGVRVLDPGRAAAVAGLPIPRPTVYRARTLLIPDHLQQDDAVIEAINEVLADVGMELLRPEPSHDTADEDGAAEEYGEVFRELRQLPRPVVLVPARGHATPVVVNAWVALQALRAAAERERPEQEQQQEAAVPGHRVLPRAVVEQIALEHLLIGSAIDGQPGRPSGGGLDREPGQQRRRHRAQPRPIPTCSAAATRAPRSRSCSTRPAPVRQPTTPSDAYGRRPVVAVLDTGVRAHPWLDVTAASGGGYDLIRPPMTVSSQVDQTSRTPSSTRASRRQATATSRAS